MTGVSAIMASLGGEAGNPALAFDFSAPPQLVSASFSGSNWLSFSPGVTVGAGAYTVEGWAYFSTASLPGVMLSTLTASNGGFTLLINSATEIRIDRNGVASDSYTVPTMASNTWHHIAATRDSSGNQTVFVDGVRSTTGAITNNSNFSGASAGVGKFNTGGQWWFTGRLSNLRAVVGSNVYDPTASTIAVPTKPLQPITNTALLLSLGNSPFINTSTTSTTITNNSTVALVDSSPFPATWTDSVSGIVATVAGAAQFGNNNPTYDGRFGGGLMFGESPRQTYVDVPTSRGVGGGFTISIAAQIPGQPQNHYNAIICGNVVSRSGRYVMSRYWQGDGLEFGHIENWVAVNMGSPTSIPLSWYDYVYSANGTTVTLYRNGSQIGTGTVSGTVLGWLNPLRFGGDESITGVNANTMATGVLYRMIHTKSALSAGEVTTQFNAVRATYGL
jgi:hypothetical protein